VATFVEAEFACADGKTRKLRRTMVVDFGGNSPCQSNLELDGAACSEPDIENVIGIRLLHPPLRAPVLAQHSLGYVFSASPTDRAAYFRAVLDTQDIEDFRAAVASLAEEIREPDAPELADLAAVGLIPELTKDVATIKAAKDNAGLERALDAAVRTLLGVIGVIPESSSEKRIDQLAETLESRRKLAFPLSLFSRKPLAGWTDPSTGLAVVTATFETERAAVDAETRRLVSLFESALSIPAIAQCKEPIDCPVCGTEGALTPERVTHIRGQVSATKAYQDAEKGLARELRAIDSKVQSLADSAAQALPKFMQITSAERRKDGFHVDRVVTLSGDVAAVATWLTHSATLWRKTTALNRAVVHARALVKEALDDISHWNDAAVVTVSLAAVEAAEGALVSAHAGYGPVAQAVGSLLKSAVDQSAKTNGWEELGRFAKDPKALFMALGMSRIYEAKIKALEQALRQIDAGNGKVADEKFTDLSNEISAWWERCGLASLRSSVLCADVALKPGGPLISRSRCRPMRIAATPNSAMPWRCSASRSFIAWVCRCSWRAPSMAGRASSSWTIPC
jgi:hypothetical protein